MLEVRVLIHLIKGNLFDTDSTVIAHQVNCQGVMGSGVARQVKEKYPEAYDKYQEECFNKAPNLLMGTVDIIPSRSDVHIIANMYAQNDFGYNGQRYTNYEAFYRCLENLNQSLLKEYSVAFPYRIGCDRGGADWDIILQMITSVFKTRDVYIYQL